MKIIIFLLLAIPALAQADSCTCKAYPFTPDPPCFKECVKLLVTDKSISLKSIKGLDPGVAVSIDTLRENRGEKFTAHEFDGINNKTSLEMKAAEKVLKKDSK